jgi:hypothetical protein
MKLSSPWIREKWRYVCGEIRAHGPNSIWSGGFFCRRIETFFNVEDRYMDKRELAYTKQTLLAVKDWDAFQDVLRFWTKLIRPSVTAVCPVGAKKK